MDKYSYIANAHANYIDELYSQFKENPESVDESWQRFFEGFEFSSQQYGETPEVTPSSKSGGISSSQLKKEVAVMGLIDSYRTRGHLESRTNPIRPRKNRNARLELKDFGLTDADLNSRFEASEIIGIGANKTLKEIIEMLKKVYVDTIGYEYMSIRETEILEWFQYRVERERLKFSLPMEEKIRVLEKLNKAVVFEGFLHTKYIGQKRFSLEGGESVIPALDAIINEGVKHGLKEVFIGMAHRGRLNVLTNVMGKPYGQIFTEFEGGGTMDEARGDGDVKYHMGYTSDVKAMSGENVTLHLAPNPSHLEAVDPVVLGFTRAKLDTVYDGDYNKVIPILIHGDAAVAGQGIVYEVVQMSRLNAYNVGGTIHFIINNQVGFTTDFQDARSSIYSTDLSSLVEAPELHVNGDDPEALMFAIKLAVEFRQKYHRDVFIDMVCYRKHGHNESDEPRFTQPTLYNLINKHKNVRDIYANVLESRGDISREAIKKLDKDFKAELNEQLQQVRANKLPFQAQRYDKAWKKMKIAKNKDFLKSPDTFISEENIEKIGRALTTIPDGFKLLRQTQKLMRERSDMFFDKKELNWAAAELMAYGSLLLDGKPVRLSGQDVQRGTFSHRHAVLSDANTNEKYSNLNHISEGQKEIEIYNSLLSEYGVLGFEYGYSTATPDSLVIWEAQFGDFANGAQIIIDQFISSSESKWLRMSSLVMLLPHGYEGQGPEHSNARPERYLQLCAQNNMVVTNITTPANFFHLLRRQMTWDFRKPCVVMTPKSLLRNPKVVSPLSDFTQGGFKEVYSDEFADKHKEVKRALLCTGKIYYDLLAYQQEHKRKDVAIIRVEQLHPFPEAQVDTLLEQYPNLEKTLWVQEEPANMGYWTFVHFIYFKNENLKLVSRKPAASPATGYMSIHNREQNRIVDASFNK